MNPTAAVAESIPKKPVKSGKDFLALVIATCGVGYFPIAPGTWGSLLAVGIYFVLRIAFLSYPIDADARALETQFVVIELVLILAVTLAGIWAASHCERLLDRKDPGKVVIDEVAGQLIALLAVPLAVDYPWPAFMFIPFILFRLFDIVKPYPARKFESLRGGMGIMTDDLVAGVYAAIVVFIARWLV
jgi:phosphatidylglycerophosphatase A